MDPENSTVLVASGEESGLTQNVDAIVEKDANRNNMAEVNAYFLVTNVEERDKNVTKLPSASSESDLPWSQMCRICATTNNHLIPIFQNEDPEHLLVDKIHKYLPIRVSETDNLPLQVCYHCAATILAWHDLSEGCLTAQSKLLQMQTEYEEKQSRLSTVNSTTENAIKESVDENWTGDNELPPEQRETPKETTVDKDENESESNEPDRSGKAQTPFKVYLEMQNINWKLVRKPTSVSGKSESETAESAVWFTMIQPETCPTSTNLETDRSKPQLEKAQGDSPGSPSESQSEAQEKAPQTKNPRRACPENNETFRCQDCGRAFKLKDSFLRHMRIHKDERPFTCHVCGKQFRDSGGLSRHLKDVHAKLKNFACDLCGNSFASKATRDDHRRTHTGERPYVCDSCGKTFKSKASLYIHSKLHTDDFPHPCTYCSKKFRRRHEMLAHVTTHTGEKNYPCDICAKRFRVKSELVRHKLVHSKEKPFTCSLCGLAFRQRRYLNSHIKSRHADVAKSNGEAQ